MKHTEVNNIAPLETQRTFVEQEAELPQMARSEERQNEVPCSCPGCFSFDF